MVDEKLFNYLLLTFWTYARWQYPSLPLRQSDAHLRFRCMSDSLSVWNIEFVSKQSLARYIASPNSNNTPQTRVPCKEVDYFFICRYVNLSCLVPNGPPNHCQLGVSSPF